MGVRVTGTVCRLRSRNEGAACALTGSLRVTVSATPVWLPHRRDRGRSGAAPSRGPRDECRFAVLRLRSGCSARDAEARGCVCVGAQACGHGRGAVPLRTQLSDVGGVEQLLVGESGGEGALAGRRARGSGRRRASLADAHLDGALGEREAIVLPCIVLSSSKVSEAPGCMSRENMKIHSASAAGLGRMIPCARAGVADKEKVKCLIL